MSGAPRFGSQGQSQQGWKAPQRSFGSFGSTAAEPFGSTQGLGNGMFMRQMGPSMMPFRNSGPDYFPQRPGSTQDMGNGMSMKQMGDYWQQQKAWTPPPPPSTTPQQPPPTQPPPTQPPATRPTPAPTPPNPGAPPGRPNPGQFPGLPQIYLDNLSYGPGGRLMFGGDQPVKYENGRLTFDTQPFVPGAGQFGQYGAPGANGFSLDTTGGINRIVGGANGPQIYNAEGLVQGSPAPQNFVNYLNSYRR